MRITEVTESGLVDRLRGSNEYPLPCPACGYAFTVLATEHTLRREATGVSLTPTAAILACEECGWKLNTSNPLYVAWTRSYAVRGIQQRPRNH